MCGYEPTLCFHLRFLLYVNVKLELETICKRLTPSTSLFDNSFSLYQLSTAIYLFQVGWWKNRCLSGALTNLQPSPGNPDLILRLSPNIR
jgi:hypothetical protein